MLISCSSKSDYNFKDGIKVYEKFEKIQTISISSNQTFAEKYCNNFLLKNNSSFKFNKNINPFQEIESSASQIALAKYSEVSEYLNNTPDSKIVIFAVLFSDKNNPKITANKGLGTEKVINFAYNNNPSNKLLLDVFFFLNKSNLKAGKKIITKSDKESLKLLKKDKAKIAAGNFDINQSIFSSENVPYLDPIVFIADQRFLSIQSKKVSDLLIKAFTFNTDFYLLRDPAFLKKYNDISESFLNEINESIVPLTFEDNNFFLLEEPPFFDKTHSIKEYFQIDSFETRNINPENFIYTNIIKKLTVENINKIYKFSYQRKKRSSESITFQQKTASFIDLDFLTFDKYKMDFVDNSTFIINKMKYISELSPAALFYITYLPEQESYYSDYYKQQTITAFYKLIYKELPTQKIRFRYISKPDYIQMKNDNKLPKKSGLQIEISFPEYK